MHVVYVHTKKYTTCARLAQLSNPLEPLLLKIARDFSDDMDLSDRLHRLYEVCMRSCARPCECVMQRQIARYLSL